MPSNAFFKMLMTDLDSLCPSSHWTSIGLDEDQILLWSSDDQKGAYYCFSLPDCWLPYFCFAWPVDGSVLDHPEWGETYLSCCVIPMGWGSAVSLFQHIHRRLGFLEIPRGAQHELAKEWRRDQPVPIYISKKLYDWVQFYLDDFDCPEAVEASTAQDLVGTVPDAQQRQRDAYKHVGIQTSEDKAVSRSPIVERMGAQVDGIVGTVRVPIEKVFTACVMCLFLHSCPLVHLRCLQAALGRLIRIFEFRRPLFGTLNNIWKFGQAKMVHPFTDRQRTELLVALCLVPLAYADIRAPVCGMVTASDASAKGGGSCVSSGLTPLGLQELETALAQEPSSITKKSSYVDTHLLDPCTENIQPILRQLSCAPCCRVLVVGLFDGIAGLLCAVSRLPITVVGFASSEIDPRAKKLVRKRWPGVIELGDVTKVDHDTVESLARTYSSLVDFVLVGAGSPCQDLSSLLYDRQGLEGSRSKLFFEVPRIIELLRSFFLAVHFFVENVFSMTDESRATFSAVLGLKPYLVDAVNFTYCRRPRLFWCSWKLSENSCKIQDRGGYYEVYVQVTKLKPDFWLDEGAEWSPSQGFVNTLTRALPHHRPPKAPAGFERASKLAKARWAADNFCFQVYQYENRAMVVGADGLRRVPSESERELLMGFDRGYLAAAFDEKMTARRRFIEAAQMLGNSFCVPVVAYIVTELLHSEKHLSEPLPPEVCLALKAYDKPWSSKPVFTTGHEGSDTEQSRELVWQFLRRAEKGGSDVRLGLNIPFRPKAWPRAGIPSRLWTWSIVDGYKFKWKAHINALEMQAALHSLKWRARKASNLGKRFLHLIDSQVCAAILTKGRTSSLRLRKTIRKVNALTLACQFYPSFGYVHTEENPADIPSRWSSPTKPNKNKKRNV